MQKWMELSPVVKRALSVCGILWTPVLATYSLHICVFIEIISHSSGRLRILRLKICKTGNQGELRYFQHEASSLPLPAGYCVLTQQKDGREQIQFLKFLVKSPNPNYGLSILELNCLLNTKPLNNITLAIKFQHMNLGAHFQTIVLTLDIVLTL